MLLACPSPHRRTELCVTPGSVVIMTAQFRSSDFILHGVLPAEGGQVSAGLVIAAPAEKMVACLRSCFDNAPSAGTLHVLDETDVEHVRTHASSCFQDFFKKAASEAAFKEFALGGSGVKGEASPKAPSPRAKAKRRTGEGAGATRKHRGPRSGGRDRQRTPRKRSRQ